MGMHDVDFELVYQPEKDELPDPLDFLFRHLLPETGRESVEKMVEQVRSTEIDVMIWLMSCFSAESDMDYNNIQDYYSYEDYKGNLAAAAVENP